MILELLKRLVPDRWGAKFAVEREIIEATAWLIEGATDLFEARERLARGARSGDLDHLIRSAEAANQKRGKWLNGG